MQRGASGLQSYLVDYLLSQLLDRVSPAYRRQNGHDDGTRGAENGGWRILRESRTAPAHARTRTPDVHKNPYFCLPKSSTPAIRRSCCYWRRFDRATRRSACDSTRLAAFKVCQYRPAITRRKSESVYSDAVAIFYASEISLVNRKVGGDHARPNRPGEGSRQGLSQELYFAGPL